MPRTSERQRKINEVAASLNRMKKYYILLVASKCSRTIINNAFKVHMIQYIKYTKLTNTRYLKPRKKNRTYKGRSVFMRHLHDKVGRKKYMNDREFLQTYRMSRKAFKNW